MLSLVSYYARSRLNSCLHCPSKSSSSVTECSLLVLEILRQPRLHEAILNILRAYHTLGWVETMYNKGVCFICTKFHQHVLHSYVNASKLEGDNGLAYQDYWNNFSH